MQCAWSMAWDGAWTPTLKQVNHPSGRQGYWPAVGTCTEVGAVAAVRVAGDAAVRHRRPLTVLHRVGQRNGRVPVEENVWSLTCAERVNAVRLVDNGAVVRDGGVQVAVLVPSFAVCAEPGNVM